MAHTLKLVSFDLCPYVERSRIVLFEKALAHELEFIDLRHKPAWFLAISPMGKVPVLIVDGKPVFESMVINELLEELYPAPRLLPQAPLDRAEARGWIVYANDAVMPAGHRAMLALSPATGSEAERAAQAASLDPVRAAFETLERHLEQRDAKFFLGDTLGLVDAAYAPFLRRWSTADEWGEAPLLPAFPRLTRYAETLLSHPSVQKADPGQIGTRMRPLYVEMARRAAA
jgi:glutathione S-transferase